MRISIDFALRQLAPHEALFFLTLAKRIPSPYDVGLPINRQTLRPPCRISRRSPFVRAKFAPKKASTPSRSSPLRASCSVTPPRRRPGSPRPKRATSTRSEEHTSELQSRENLVCRLLLEKKEYTAI